MSRQRLTLELAAEHVATAEALLTLAGAETIALRDAADDAVFEPEPGTTPLWPNVVLEALFTDAVEAESLRRLLATTFPVASVTLEALEEAAWAPKLAQSLKARAIGARLWVAPATDTDTDVPSDRLVVRITWGSRSVPASIRRPRYASTGSSATSLRV